MATRFPVNMNSDDSSSSFDDSDLSSTDILKTLSFDIDLHKMETLRKVLENPRGFKRTKQHFAGNYKRLKELISFQEYFGKPFDDKRNRSILDDVLDNIFYWCRARRIRDSYLNASTWTI